MIPSMASMSDEVRQIIGEAVGEASMCWDPLPGNQVFDSTRASKIVDETAKKLKLAKIHIEGRKNYCRGCGKPDHRGLCSECAFPKEKTARKLTYKARENLSAGAFVFPKDRRYPIHDESHARNALARASGKPEEAQVRAAVHSKYPGIGKTSSVEDAAEQAHNVLINTHFFLKDNREGLHPAHARHIKALEDGVRTLVKELDPYAPRTAHTYADGHAENCKTAGVTNWAASHAARAAKYLRTLPTAVPRNVKNTVKGFGSPMQSMKKGWHSDNNLGRAMTVGFAGMDAMDAMKKQDPSGRNRGRAERVGAAIGNTAGGLIGLPHGTLSGGIVGSGIGSFVGGRAGRMVDGAAKVVRRPPAPKPLAPVEAK